MAVCLGKVEYVRRTWVSMVGQSGSHGAWWHWARVRIGGRTRLVPITAKAFRRFLAKKVTRKPDACWFPNSGARPPSKTVEERT